MGFALGERLDSMAWISASMELVAKNRKGSPPSSSGIITAWSAYMASLAKPFLVRREIRARMEMFVTSVPVPQVVGTKISSLPFSMGSLPSYRSRMGETCLRDRIFATSSTVPPPTATMRVMSLGMSR